MRKITALLALCLALLLAWCAPAAAGWEIHYQGSGFGPSAAYIQDNQLRQDMGPVVSIFDLNKGTITYLNQTRKTYWQGTPEQMAASARSGADKQVQKMLKGMPPELRKKMQAAMAQQKKQPQGPRFSVQKTGRSEKIAGYDCAQYLVSSQGQKVVELWIAPIDVSSELNVDRMTKVMAEMSSRAGRSPMASGEVLALFKKGYPLKQVIYLGPQKSQTVAKSVKKKPLAGSLFAVPPGFRQAPSFMGVMH